MSSVLPNCTVSFVFGDTLLALLLLGEAAFRGLPCVFQLKAENMHNEENTIFSCLHSSLNILWL